MIQKLRVPFGCSVDWIMRAQPGSLYDSLYLSLGWDLSADLTEISLFLSGYVLWLREDDGGKSRGFMVCAQVPNDNQRWVVQL